MHHRAGAPATEMAAAQSGRRSLVFLLGASVTVILAAVLLFALLGKEVRAAQSKVEAESMTLSGSSVVVHRSSTASGGKDVAFYTNGAAKYSFGGAAADISLRARGQACQGSPKLKIYVDGSLKGTVDLTSNTF